MVHFSLSRVNPKVVLLVASLCAAPYPLWAVWPGVSGAGQLVAVAVAGLAGAFVRDSVKLIHGSLLVRLKATGGCANCFKCSLLPGRMSFGVTTILASAL